MLRVERRSANNAVALETTLLVHGVPRAESARLCASLGEIVRSNGANPALVGILGGRAIVGMTAAELDEMLASPRVEKANTSNLGVLIHRGSHAATTVSATMELAAAAGVRVFATGGLGGLHHGLAERPDISADLGAFTRFPVAVVTSGVKNILDVEGTRELLETLGVTVVGYQTDRFPAFYLRESSARVDARFDTVPDLAGFLRAELVRTGRGVVVCNPVPVEHELDHASWVKWLAEARAGARADDGRSVTPDVLARLHQVSNGATLRANIELVKNNAALAAKLAAAM